MFESIQTITISLQVVAAISLLLAVVVLPWLIYSKNKTVAAKLLLTGSFLFLGSLVFSLILNISPGGQALISDAKEYRNALRLLIGNLGNLGMSISAILFLIGMWHFVNTKDHESIKYSKNGNKTIKQISICLLAVVALSGVGYASFRSGIKATHVTSAVPYMSILKMQNECIEKDDIDCIETTNAFALEVLTTHLESLKEHNLLNENTKEINDFLSWNKTRK